MQAKEIIFDKKGRQILDGDLLKVFHFKTKKKIHYMFHVAVLYKDTGKDYYDGYFGGKSYYSIESHYHLRATATKIKDNKYIMKEAEIISEKDWETKRLKIKVK